MKSNRRTTEQVFKRRQGVKNRAECPVLIIGIVFPLRSMAVEKNAWTGVDQELVHLAGCIPQVNIAVDCISHIDAVATASVNENVWVIKVLLWD